MMLKTTRPREALRSAFLAHPHSIGETYFQHLFAALGFAGSLAITALAATLHAIVPCLCETTARRRIQALHQKLQHRAPVNSAPEPTAK